MFNLLDKIFVYIFNSYSLPNIQEKQQPIASLPF